MPEGSFAFEDCLLKHYIRKEVWLPKCRHRLAAIKRAAGNKPARRLRYFTFCAVGALDVLLLDREKVIRRSKNKEFDTVFFFDKDEDAIVETRKRIPGANGFPGDFVKVVLDTADGDGLESPADAQNTRAVREAQQNQAQRKVFINSFPFDVLNLDVEQYLFRPKEDLPGRLTAALREIFEWQKRAGTEGSGKKYFLNEFTLMFTSQVGPPGLPDHYIAYLRDTCLQQNITKYPELQPLFDARAKGMNVADFFASDFDAAFRLSVPKSLIELALESDWHIDGDEGIEVYQFDRPSQDGPYRMLHFAMTVRRQVPTEDKRAPGQGVPALAEAENRKAVLRLFEKDTTPVEPLVTGAEKEKLAADLRKLFDHRERYYKPEPEPEVAESEP